MVLLLERQGGGCARPWEWSCCPGLARGWAVSAAPSEPVPIARPDWASALWVPRGKAADSPRLCLQGTQPWGHGKGRRGDAVGERGGAAGRAADWDAKVHKQKAKGTFLPHWGRKRPHDKYQLLLMKTSGCWWLLTTPFLSIFLEDNFSVYYKILRNTEKVIQTLQQRDWY